MGGVYEECCFLGLRGVRNTWFLGVETRNKCLYVVSDQLGALESLQVVAQERAPPEDAVLVLIIVFISFSRHGDLLEFWPLGRAGFG